MTRDENPLPGPLSTLLKGRVWHATSFTNFDKIAEAGEIRPDAESRHRTAFCRSGGGVSLFDFRVSPTTINDQFGNWHGWLGSNFEVEGGLAIWMCVNPAAIEFEDAPTLLQRWKDTPAVEPPHGMPYKPMIIPGVEACHCGPIPLDAVEGVVITDGKRLLAFDLIPAGPDLWAAVARRHAADLASRPPKQSFYEVMGEAEERGG